MAMFKAAATEQLKLLCVFFLLGHLYRVLPAKPASACESDLDERIFVAHYFLFQATVIAASLLLAVRMAVNNAEADSLAAGAYAGARVNGLASVAAGWKRAALRGTFLFAVGLSTASAFLAVSAFEDGYRSRRGCAAGADGSRSPMAVVLLVFAALLHGFFAWVAVWKD